MHSQSWATVLLLMCIASPAVSQSYPDLLTALRQSGASKFADRIASDPEVLNVYHSDVGTVFAPADLMPTARGLQERELSPEERRQTKYQGGKQETSLAQTSLSLPGAPITTVDNASKLDNTGQVVVADTRPANSTSPTRRWNSRHVSQRQSSQIARSLLRLSSGLGKTTNVIRGDIKFDRGLIHITDSYFTLPDTLSSTSQATGQAAFANLAASGNLTGKLDNMHSITAFVPSNAALSTTSNMSASAAAQLTSNHIVSGFVGYLPNLKDGATLTTQIGQILTIKVRGGIYYINDAKITQANMILDNGVAHVIDKVLTPKGPQPVITSGSTPSKTVGLTLAFGVLGSMALFALF